MASTIDRCIDRKEIVAMKIQIAILMFGCISAAAQEDGNFLGSSRLMDNPLTREQARINLLNFEHNFIPKDPWRNINGSTNYAKGAGWVLFKGKILEVQPTGVRIEGWWEVQGIVRLDVEFFVAGFPYQVVENQIIGPTRQPYSAKESGVYTYPTVTGGTRTIRKLDYGVPCDPPEELLKRANAQAEARAAAVNKRKQESDEHALKWLLSQSTKDRKSVV